MITKEWLERMKQKIGVSSNSNQNINWVFMPKDPGKKMVVRIIDPPKQEGFAEVIFKHYGVPSPDGKPRTFNCLRNYGMECPICNTVMFHKDVSEVKRMRAISRYYFNVLVRKHDEMQGFNPEQVYVMVAPQSVFVSVLKYLTEAEYYIPNLLDPKEGYDIVIERLPDNKLKVEATRTPTPLVQDENKIQEILDSVYDLKSFLPKYDESIMQQAKQIADVIKNSVNRLEKAITDIQTDNAPPALGQNGSTNLPECFGKYDPNNVDCLSCVYEISCLKQSQK